MKKTIVQLAFIVLAVNMVFISVGWAAPCPGSGLTWNCPAGTTVATVNETITAASNGATINFATGSYTWSDYIHPDGAKGVTLMGAGAGSTMVDITGGSIDMEGSTVDNPYRISGFTFTGTPGGTGCVIWLVPTNGVTLTNMRIDHNAFTDTGIGYITIMTGGTTGHTTGLIDHNTLTGTNEFMLIKVLGPGAASAAPTSPKGTANNIFIEDNTANFTSDAKAGAGLIDCWNSGSVVFRHNTVINAIIGAHDADHGGGCLSFEIYNNTLTATSQNLWPNGTRLIHHQGSGEEIIFNNIFTAVGTKSTNPMDTLDYRGCPKEYTGTLLDWCDGNNPLDGNWSPVETYRGYPCWRQAGRMNAGSRTSTGQPGTLSPLYEWNNYWSDTHGQVVFSVYNSDCPTPYTTTHIVQNRDYYDAVSTNAQTSATSPFNGTTGMGFGTLANRPATCTTNALETGGGVGYFATDQGAQGTLYRCSATNTWTVQYTPYTYPHPLSRPQPLSSPQPPQNLKIKN